MNNRGINCDGWKVYLSQALKGYSVGLQAVRNGYRVWFYHVLLGFLAPGIHQTLQPNVSNDEPER